MRTRRNFNVTGITALTAVALFATDARADERRLDLGIFLGAHVFSENNELGAFDLRDADSPSNALAGGARVSYRVDKMFSAEGELSIMPSSARNGTADLMVFGFRLQGLAHFAPEDAKLRPFALVGTSLLAMTSSDDDIMEDDTDWVGLHAGGGASYRIDPKTALRADARLFFPPSSANNYVTTEFEITVGAFRTFELGGGGSTTAHRPKPDPKTDPTPPADDADGDGVLGAADKCPDQAEDKDGFQDEDGCPELDNDGDGIADLEDQCPNKPETINEIEDQDGCPETDEDNDGILSPMDKCPTAAEDVDNFQDEDGCPELDNDGDAIEDRVDQCPDKAETKNLFQDADGCPDEIPARLAKFIGAVKGLRFARKARLHRSSYKLLNKAAKVLTEFKELKLEIQGHTDNRGDDEKNRILSQVRANIVKAYLVKKGIATERLTAKGYGETMPITDNKTKKARKQNRRIEFKLVP